MQGFLTNKISIVFAAMLLLWMLPIQLVGQTAVNMDNLYVCENTEVLLPVYLEDFEDVAAFTLYIGVNTDLIQFVGVEDINALFLTGDFVGGINEINQTIVITWASFTPAHAESALICNLRIVLSGDAAVFDFLNECEIVRSDLSIVEPVEYRNGNILALKSFIPNPATQSAIEGSSVSISVEELTDNVEYKWQEKNEIDWTDLENSSLYSGVHTNQLSIESVLEEMNGKIFRCLLVTDHCSVESGESELLVTPNGYDDNEANLSAPIHIYPIPADEFLNINFDSKIENAEIKILNVKGQILMTKSLGDVDSGKSLSLQLETAEQGIYFLQLFSKGQFLYNRKFIRL